MSLNGVQLKVVTRWTNLYSYDILVEKNGNSSVKIIGGYAYNILEELSLILNFSYIFCQNVGTTEFANATAHGIDIFAASYSLYEARARIVDPTFVIGSSRVIALINHDFENHAKISFFHPFNSILWYSLSVFAVLCFLVFAAMGFVEDTSVDERVLHALAVLLQQNTNCVFTKFSSRLILWLIMIATIILMNSYIGSMVAQITIKRFQINSLESLVDSNFLLLLERGLNNGSAIQGIAEALTGMPIMKIFMGKAEQAKFVYESFEKSIELVQNSPSAYVIDEETAFATLAESYLGELPCSWSTISVAGIHYPWSMFVRKNWIYKTTLNSGLLLLHQHGMLNRARKRWIPSKGSECSTRFSKNYEDVPIANLGLAFGICGFGGVISLIVLLTLEKNIFAYLVSRINKIYRRPLFETISSKTFR